jgi:ABC-type nitrate/sulfonate/bicarbonate transport system substrate-binding protein
MRSPRRPTLRSLTAGAGSLLLAGALAACSSASTSPSSSTTHQFPGTITIAYPVNVGQFMILPFTQSQGIFKKYGLNVNIKVVNGSVLLPTLESGQINIAVDASPQLELAETEGVPVKLIGYYSEHSDNYLIAAPGIKTLSQMKGHPIGASSATALSTVLVKYALYLGHVSFADVRFVPSGTDPIGDFDSGFDDAYVTAPPELQANLAGRAGSSLIYHFLSLDWPGGDIAGYEPWLKTHKAEAVAFLQALSAGMVAWNKHESAAEKTIETVAGVTQASSVSATYASTERMFNHTSQPIQAPSTKIESFVYKVLREVGFPAALSKYANVGEFPDPTYWNAAFPKS